MSSGTARPRFGKPERCVARARRRRRAGRAHPISCEFGWICGGALALRYNHGMVALSDGRLAVLGGLTQTSSAALDRVDLYRIAEDRWQ